MVSPIIENGRVLIENEHRDGWDDELRRAAQPHETILAMISIIEEMQGRIAALESWRNRASK